MTDFKYHLNRNGFIGLKILTWKHGGYITTWCKSTWFSENSFIHKLPCERTLTFFKTIQPEFMLTPNNPDLDSLDKPEEHMYM